MKTLLRKKSANAAEFKNILDEKMAQDKPKDEIEKTTFKNSKENIETLIEKYAQKK